MDAKELIEKLLAADIAFAPVNDPAGLAQHPHLRRIAVETPSGPASYPAPAPIRSEEPRRYGAVPALGAHTDKVRAEFMSGGQ
jgi:formyl-CoA transferase